MFSSRRTPLWIYILLFVISFITSMIAGAQWAYKDYSQIENWHYGIQYALLVLGFLTAHEFGHYFAAKYHKVDATLPYYIPFPFPQIPINFGTMGAVIKTRTPIPNRKALFDIGIAGPLAGFVVAVIYLIYGFTHLPPVEYLLVIHPNYYHTGIPDNGLFFGNTLFFEALKNFLVPNGAFVPPMNEVYHYPFLNVGWFALFVTTLNMLPMGQLDGGHIIYAMFGRYHRLIARIVWWSLLIIGLGGTLKGIHELLLMDYSNSIVIALQRVLLPVFDFINKNLGIWFAGWSGWLFWALLAKYVIKIDHPPIAEAGKLGNIRKALGWISFIILMLSFSYTGIYIIE